MTAPHPPTMRGLLNADGGVPVPRPAARPSTEPEPGDLVPPRPPDEFDPGWVGLGETLPAGTAMLCVTGSGSTKQPRLSLTWHHARTVQSAPNQPELPRLGLSLARLMKEAAEEADATPVRPGREGPWSAAYYQVRNWWQYQSTLVRWIRELFATAPQPRLVIWDNTAHNIPWELFYHQPSATSGSGPEGWLGELVPVVRWTSVHDGPRIAGYSAAQHVSKGSLLMLEEESLAVPDDGFTRYVVEPRVHSIDELMQRLDGTGEPPGLVMIRCHGFYAQSASEFTIGGPSLNRFTGYSMRTLREFQPPVVLNSCASGQAIQDKQLPGRPVRSFVELFLRYGASAVVAVNGDIDIDHSHEFATRLVASAAERPVNLAAALQEHRRYYCAELGRQRPGRDPKDVDEDYKHFLTSFLYVYYGHPDTTLHLTQPADGATGGDGTGRQEGAAL
ncbi:CHAT domain-containing protein [Kitasatospora sp. NPDC058406]|uniref:CHAT domain-containing protein n=1 Tax=Kitasatospora sp. NPDC058406 TaxID=3346483 RepID=UPI00364DA55C